MSSTRSTNNQSSAPAETPRDALTAVARHGARIQVAALTAAGSVVAGWARAADRLVQAIGEELLRRVDGETDSRQLVVHVAVATNAHLRELAALPTAAATQFDTRLAGRSIDN
jgi:hypothetical protein